MDKFKVKMVFMKVKMVFMFGPAEKIGKPLGMINHHTKNQFLEVKRHFLNGGYQHP